MFCFSEKNEIKIDLNLFGRKKNVVECGVQARTSVIFESPKQAKNIQLKMDSLKVLIKETLIREVFRDKRRPTGPTGKVCVKQVLNLYRMTAQKHSKALSHGITLKDSYNRIQMQNKLVAPECVVYFEQLLGTARTQKLVELLFLAVFKLFCFMLCNFNFFYKTFQEAI